MPAPSSRSGIVLRAATALGLAALLTCGPTSARAQSPAQAPVSAPARDLRPVAPTPAGQTLHLRSLAATCAQCHGTDGRALTDAGLEPLAGRPREELLALLSAFRSGQRPATVMHQISLGYSVAQLEQLAGHFASLPR
jgi:cytochrome c553